MFQVISQLCDIISQQLAIADNEHYNLLAQDDILKTCKIMISAKL